MTKVWQSKASREVGPAALPTWRSAPGWAPCGSAPAAGRPLWRPSSASSQLPVLDGSQVWSVLSGTATWDGWDIFTSSSKEEWVKPLPALGPQRGERPAPCTHSPATGTLQRSYRGPWGDALQTADPEHSATKQRVAKPAGGSGEPSF